MQKNKQTKKQKYKMSLFVTNLKKLFWVSFFPKTSMQDFSKEINCIQI